MIVRFAKGGKSFKGLAAYLMHDPDKARTSGRVAWTRTLNLAITDDVPSAVNEMLWTYRAADQLKRQAGISTGGKPLENSVKHFSLNWAKSDEPTPEHMVDSVKHFLRHLGWQEHQAILVAHNDKEYAHVHVMVNAVNPNDGRALDTSFEHSRASSWALQYEQEQFRIHCLERLKPYGQREASPTREAWMKMKSAEKEFESASRVPDWFERGDERLRSRQEWQILKTDQHEERTAFFASGKAEFKQLRDAIFREVRTEFRGYWKEYYAAKRQGAPDDELAEMKAGILARQNAELESRRDAACKELRDARDLDYRLLLDRQKQMRAWLADRQERGLETPQLLAGGFGPRNERKSPEMDGHPPANRDEPQLREDGIAAFGAAAREACTPQSERKEPQDHEHEDRSFKRKSRKRHRVRRRLTRVSGLGLGALGAIAEIGERLFDGFLGGSPAKPQEARPAPPQPRSKQRAIRASAARETEARQRATAQQVDEAEQAEAFWQERRRSRGRDR